MSTEPNSFSKYLVIFVDILGSQNRTDFQEMYQINKIFYDEFEKNQKNDRSHTAYERNLRIAKSAYKPAISSTSSYVIIHGAAIS